jgi:hypothetical protein
MALIVAWQSPWHHRTGEWATLDKPLDGYAFAALLGDDDDEPGEGDETTLVDGRARFDDGTEQTFEVWRSYRVDYVLHLDAPEVTP